jgi:hypothetical protein
MASAWELLFLTSCCLVAAGWAFRRWRRLSKLGYQELEKELLGEESFHIPLQKRMANAEAIQSRLAILVVGIILVACVLSWKTLKAFFV